ncbi:MAG: polysaccharide biosynthesis tyrosine autokinase [Bacteroidetes bacterium]|nr:polysaccharide biosynthesis tyrosine autokinase [Bacteroidota bacterium]
MANAKQHKSSVQKEDNLVTQLLAKYITYWPAFLIFVIVAVSGAYVYLRYTTPLYEATATLIIKDEKKGADDSKLMESLNMISTKKIIENEVEVLQSRSLMENVVKSLHLYAPVFIEGKVKAQPAYTASPLEIVVADPDSITEAPKVPFSYDQSKGSVFLNGKQVGVVNEWISTGYGRLKFIPNKKYVPHELGKQFYFSLLKTKDVTNNILKGLKVAPASKLSSVISLSYKDPIPQRAEDVLNSLIYHYDRAAIDEKNSLAKNTLEFVDDRLSIVKHDLDSVERNVQQYKASSGATDISAEGQIYLQSMGAIDQKVSEYNAQLAAVDQVERALSSGSNGGGMMPAAMGISDQTLTTQMSNLNAAELEYEKLKKTVAENNPILISVKDQIEKLKPAIIQNVQNQRKNLEASRANLLATSNGYTSKLSSIPQKERQLVELTRDQNTKNGIYSFLLQKKEESELSYASTLSDSRVVNKAQSSKFPVSPNKMLIYFAAVALAIGGCIGFISLREMLSRKVLYRHELESMTSVPIIGEVAFNKSKDELVIKSGQRSFIAEEFRKIRVSLHFLGIDQTKKKVLVTSSIPGEGKSFIAANLAISNSLSGKKVILVDLDLHKPGLSKMFDKSTDDPGMSDYLTGDKELNEIIKKVPNYENLYFISSGSLNESPSELLLNGKIDDFIAELESKYDLVVLDTAPTVLVTDAFVLTKLVNATLYVVRHKYTPKILIKRIDDNLSINPLTNPGIVFNGVKTRGFFKSNYGYGYDYVYGDRQTKKEKREMKLRTEMKAKNVEKAVAKVK